MHFNLDNAPISLRSGAILNITDGEGRSLHVLEGRVWLTQEGSLDDVFLDAGQSHTIDGSGAAVVTAEGASDAAATVVFDVPLSIRSRSTSSGRWFEFLNHPWRAHALA